MRPVSIDPAARERLLAPPAGTVDVVIDTDVTNEIDDQFALVWAMLRPDRVRLRALHAAPYAMGEAVLAQPGFVTDLERQGLADLSSRGAGRPVVGPAEGVARAADECRTIARLCGVDVPVVDGSASFLVDEDTPVRSDAVDSLIALAHEDREGPLHVLAIGCATNVASALMADPTIAAHLAVTWTAAYPSFWPYRNASFNLAQDVTAGRVLLESGVPFTYLPGYYVGEQLRVSLEELEAHVRGRGPVGDYLYDVAASSLWYAGPGSSKVIWDLVDVAWVVDPGMLSTRLVPTPRLGPDLRWQEAGPGRHLMREADAVDRDAVYRDLFAVLAGRAGGP